jgi:hypothetical protein
MYLTLFIATLVLGLTYSILQTQNLISKNFKIFRALSGVFYATGLLVFLIHKEPNVSEFGIDALVVLNCLTVGSDSKFEKFIKNFSILLSIFIIIGMFIYLIAIS